jgi:uncharacterized protein YtpQ (UPF0354 family)
MSVIDIETIVREYNSKNENTNIKYVYYSHNALGSMEHTKKIKKPRQQERQDRRGLQ